MSPITRTWLAFAAIGAGLIHIALVLGSPVPLGIAFGILGLIEFGWGVLTFARDTVPARRAALVLALAPVIAWGVLLMIAAGLGVAALTDSLRLLPLAVASLFELFIAGVLGSQLRSGARTEASPVTPGVGRYLLGLVVGGLAVAGLTTPALAATEAGLHAQPHGEPTDLGPIGFPGHGAH